MKIYLAGKVEPNCWRHGVVRGFEDYGPHTEIIRGAIFGEHDYVGPFFDPCGHGISHGPNQHGSLDLFPDIADPDELPPVDRAAQAVVRRRCLAAISRADLVFAWLNDATCYGTLFELGYATALGRIVRIAKPYEFDTNDLWFAAGLNGCPGISNDPREALRCAIAVLERRHTFTAEDLLRAACLRYVQVTGKPKPVADLIAQIAGVPMPSCVPPEKLAVATEAINRATAKHECGKAKAQDAAARKAAYWRTVEHLRG